ncbi:MAG: AI-2E family transporter [Spirochaetota bacterium]
MKTRKKRAPSLRKESVASIKNDRKFRLVFLAIFAAVFLAIAYIFRYYMWPALFAFVFYVALKPVFDFFSRYIKTKWIAATVTVLLFVLLIVIPLLFLLLSLADQTFQFYQLVVRKFDPAAIQNFLYDDYRIRTVLERLDIGQGEVIGKISAVLQNISLSLFSNIKGMVSFSLKFIANFFFMILILFAIFMDGPKLGELVYNIIPFPRDIERVIFRRLRDVIKVLVAGNVGIMLLQGTAVAVGFFFSGLGIPLLGGCFAALFSLIPVVGTSFIWIPAVMWLLISARYGAALFITVWCLFWYLFLENWAKPKFFGEKLNFHPLVFFFLLIGSLGAFNLPGIIVGPVLLTLFYSLWEIYRIIYIEPAFVDNAGLRAGSSLKKK